VGYSKYRNVLENIESLGIIRAWWLHW